MCHPAAEFTEEQIGNYGAIAFGCPLSMGAEQRRRANSSPCSLPVKDA